MVVKGTIRAQRLLTGVEQHRPELLEEVSRQLWLRLWTRVRLPPQHSPAFLNDFIFSCFFLTTIIHFGVDLSRPRCLTFGRFDSLFLL